MIYKILVSLFAILLPHAATAKVSNDDIIYGMRDLIYAGDISQVEAYVARQQDRYLDGDIPAEHIRLLFVPFSWSNPKTADFAQAWLSEMPNSPYAQMAQAWTLRNFSRHIRGGDIARQTYPDALRTFSRMQREAWALTTAAYETMPRLITASDGMMRMANPNGQRRTALKVLDAVMAVDPNSGSLQRALDMALPGWGARFSMVEDICTKYAAKMEDAPPEPVLSCKIEGSKYFGERVEWVKKTLATHSLPHLDHYRLPTLINSVDSREDAQLVFDLLNAEGFVKRNWAFYFDAHIGPKYDMPSMDSVHMKREYDQAKKGIVDEPLHPDYLKKMMEPEMAVEIDSEGRKVVRAISHPSAELQLDYAEKLLVAEPYNPENWITYVGAKLRANPTMSYFDVEPFRVNAIVYSDHSVRHLYGYLMDKAAVYDALGQIERGEIPAEYTKPFENADAETDVICPFVRAMRLHDHICSNGENLDCKIEPQVATMFAIVEDEAKQRGICLKEQRLPASVLFFQPQEVHQGG